MAISPSQKKAIEDVIETLCAFHKGRRRICDMFMELPDREAWPEYYKVIPEPRCLKGIRSDVEKGKYKDVSLVYEDLMLVFANALHFNDHASQIAKDAKTLKELLEQTWKGNSILPKLSSPSPIPTAGTSSKRSIVSRPAPQAVTPRQTANVSLRSHSATSSLSKLQQKDSAVNLNRIGNVTEDDAELSPEPQDHETESQAEEVAARDEESAQIVKQLERGLPRWTGGDDRGWMDGGPNDDISKRCTFIMSSLKAFKTQGGINPVKLLEELPEENLTKASYDGLLSFGKIEERIRLNEYQNLCGFDQDLWRLFERARRFYDAGSEEYGSCLLLQRLYQLLSSSPYPNSIPPTSTNFSSVSAGPGIARPLHSQADASHAVTTFRIPTKDRKFTEELIYKGMSFKVGDWVHLTNPDDPSKPIIAQIFKTWVTEGDLSKQGVTACWYFRPEQTIHPAHRQFWENEIFKTGHFAEHAAQDILEKVACQFTAKHIRGRPRPPYWYPGWPLYVCDSRYNDRERVFVKIKNWNSCIPDEYRKNDFMPIYPFERIIYPKRYPSPFVTGKTGPGGITDSVDKGEGEKIDGSVGGRKRSHRTGHTDYAGPRYGTFVGVPVPIPTHNELGTIPSQAETSQSQLKRTEDKSIGGVLGGLASLNNNAVVEVLPSETVKHFDRHPDTNQVLWFSGPPTDVVRSPAPRHSLQYLHYLAKTNVRPPDEDHYEMDPGELAGPKRRRMTDVVNEMLERLVNQ